MAPLGSVPETCQITVSRDAESIFDTFRAQVGLYMPQPEVAPIKSMDFGLPNTIAKRPSVAYNALKASYLL